MKSIKLSVIIATFNSESSVSYTLDSILLQSFNNFELIIVDGKSQDKTVDILKSYKNKFADLGIGYTWISEKDSGIYDAWNKGLKLAKGKWISFIGSDDCLYDNALEEMNEVSVNHSNADFIAARAKIVRNDGTVERELGKEWRWNQFKREMKILHAAGWHNAVYFKKYGVFDSSYKITGDYEMLLRAKADLNVAFYDKFILKMGAGGVSDSQVLNASKEAYRAKVKTGERSSLIARIEFYFIYFKITLKRAIS